MEQTCILWGGPFSLYAGKVRSCLIRKGVAYRELYPSHPRYQHKVLPEVGLRVIPVLEWTDGRLIQDTSDIIAFLETVHPEPCFEPAGAVQKLVALLVCAWASARAGFDRLMARTGGAQAMQLQLKRPMRRDRHRLTLA